MKRIFSVTLSMVLLSGCGLASALNANNPNFTKATLLRTQATGSIENEVPPPPAPGEFFKVIDQNQDGYLTAEELSAAKPPEPPAGMCGRGPREAPDPAKMIERLDTDQDGKISQAEFEAGRPQGGRHPRLDPESFFNTIDANSDGYVTSEELVSLKPPADAPLMEDNRPKPDPAKMIEHLDSDGDGKLSLEEFKQGHHRPMPPVSMGR